MECDQKHLSFTRTIKSKKNGSVSELLLELESDVTDELRTPVSLHSEIIHKCTPSEICSRRAPEIYLCSGWKEK